MTQLLLGLFYALVDIVRATWGILARNRRGRYVASATVRVPITTVWELLERRDVTYTATGMRVVTEPLADHPGVFCSRILLGEREATTIAFRYLEVTAPVRMVIRYVSERSAAAVSIGHDDDVSIDLSTLPDGRTRITYARDLEHVRSATRISAPLGVRQAVFLTRSQIEHEAGIRPARAPLWHQLVWALLAFASFAWLLDWRAALALMLIIAIHEAGHALAMLWFGLGVSVVSFVPFLGGVAAPKRTYGTETQRVVVALMGVGFSLPFTLLAIWLAGHYNWPNVAMLAMLSIIINGVNLVPFPALDGSIVVSTLLNKLHKNLNHAVTILMFGMFVAIGIVLRDPLIWIGITLSFISVVQVMSIKSDAHLVSMGRIATAVTIIGFAGLIAAHVWGFRWASTTAAHADRRAMAACLEATGRNAEAIRTCREKNHFWILDRG